MFQSENKPKLFFLHIPKTAGTSLRSYLIDQYHDADVFEKNDWLSLTSSDLTEMTQFRLIMGHFDYRMLKLLPAGYKTATFLREPVSRTVSAILHAMRDPHFRPIQLDLEGKSFKEIIRDPDLVKWFANTQVSLLAPDCSMEKMIEQYAQRKSVTDPLPFMDDVVFDLELAIAHLNQFDFIGIVEEFDHEMLRFADLCGFYPLKTTPLLNIGAHSKSFKLDKEDIEILVKHNELDILLYQQALTMSSHRTPLQRDTCLKKYFSMRSPLKGNTKVNFNRPFNGWGFYEFENDGEVTCRWSGPYNYSGISIKLPQGCYKLNFKYYLDTKQFAGKVDIFVRSVKPDSTVWKELGYHYCETFLNVVDADGEVIEFTFETDRTVTPSMHGSDDLRTLGFMLVELDIQSSVPQVMWKGEQSDGVGDQATAQPDSKRLNP